MAGPWFYAPPDAWSERAITLDDDESHHGLRVLRVGRGDPVIVMDGAGRVAHGAAAIRDGRLVAEIRSLEHNERRRPEIVVYQGAAKGTKVDSALERLAELGMAEVVVYESVRSVVRWDESKRARLAARWATIARSAAKQARNPFVMRTRGSISFGDLLESLRSEPAAVVLWEEAARPLRTRLPDGAERVALVVGPEGGLESGEADALAGAGARPVSLGPLILRTENAGLVAAAAVSYHYGLIG